MSRDLSKELGSIELDFNRASDELVAWVTGPGILIPDLGVSLSSKDPKQRDQILSNIRKGIVVHNVAIETCERRWEAGKVLLNSEKFLFKSTYTRRWNDDHKRIISRMTTFRSDLIATYTWICDDLGLDSTLS